MAIKIITDSASDITLKEMSEKNNGTVWRRYLC